MGAKRGAKKGAKKGGKKGSKSKGPKVVPLEIGVSGGVKSMQTLAITTRSSAPSQQQFSKLIAQFIIKYAHPEHLFFQPKQLAAQPVERCQSLMRENTVIEVLIDGQHADLWLTEGHDPQRPAPPPVEISAPADTENPDDEYLTEEAVVTEDGPEPSFHSATVKAVVGSEFAIQISNEWVFAKIAAEIFIDGQPVLRNDGEKFLIDPAPAPPLVVEGFEGDETPLEDGSQGDTRGLSSLSVNKFAFSKRLQINDGLTRDIVNAGFDGEITINIYQ